MTAFQHELYSNLVSKFHSSTCIVETINRSQLTVIFAFCGLKE